MTRIRVVASVIERNGRVLVCQRPTHKRHGGLWEFPGGKVEPGESAFAAVERELREELDIGVRAVGEPLFSVADPGSDFVIEFLPVEIEGEPACIEHAAIEWVEEDALVRVALAPSDHRYALIRTRERQHRRSAATTGDQEAAGGDRCSEPVPKMECRGP